MARSSLPSALKSPAAMEHGVRAGGEGPSRLEGAVAVAQQHVDAAVAGGVVVTRCGQVELAVIVEVGRHDRLGIGADGETRGRGEAQQAAVFEDFPTRPADGAPLLRTAPAHRATLNDEEFDAVDMTVLLSRVTRAL